jgi:hypothetical protein
LDIEAHTQRRRVGRPAEEFGGEKKFNVEDAKGAGKRDSRAQRGIAVLRVPFGTSASTEPERGPKRAGRARPLQWRELL